VLTIACFLPRVKALLQAVVIEILFFHGNFPNLTQVACEFGLKIGRQIGASLFNTLLPGHASMGLAPVTDGTDLGV
jgi:hypothetical protein